MSISINEVNTRREMREFIYFPEKIHKNHSHWVPQIYADDKGCFCPGCEVVSCITPIKVVFIARITRSSVFSFSSLIVSPI